MVKKTTKSESIDPLEAKSSIANVAAQMAIKREIENILSSYVGWFDPFAELVQNALDSVEERQSNDKKSGYVPTIRVIINVAKQTLTVSDNGTGLSKEKYRQFLAPSFSFKAGKTRGHKGVGATFLAYGFNFIQIATKTADYVHVGKMQNARKWLTDPNPPSNPLIIPDKDPVIDPEFAKFDKGVSITLRFDATTYPGDLDWLKADTAEVWKQILQTKTGIGAVLDPLKVLVQLTVTSKSKKETSLEFATTNYNWPHEIVKKSKKLRDIESKSAELFKKRGQEFRMPSAFSNVDCMYDTFDPVELAKAIVLTSEEQALVDRYTPNIYVCYTHSARVWSDYNESLLIRGSIQLLRPGIQIAANNMPQGEMIQIPLKRNVGRQNQVHFLAHFDNCKADLGRKGFQKEIVQFCEEISRKLIEGPFQKHRLALKPATGAVTDLKRATEIEEWKREMEGHETNSPLMLENENFFLPTKQIAITSVPTREQDVIALFNQLIAGGVIRGVRIMSTNERFTYDGMYKVTLAPPKKNHIYDKKTNPLGILAENYHEGLKTHPKILEYKLSLDGLIEDLENGEKSAKDIDLVIVWETGSDYEHSYLIRSLLDEENLSEREYHGLTHVIQNQSGAREMDLIVLSELVEHLNNPAKSAKNQTEKYDN